MSRIGHRSHDFARPYACPEHGTAYYTIVIYPYPDSRYGEAKVYCEACLLGVIEQRATPLADPWKGTR